MFNSKSYKTTPAYACLLLAVIALSSAQVKADELASPKEIVAMLKQGGYVIYLRHGATNHKQNDGDLSDLRECSNQRNLSSQGKKESRILGETFKKLGIKIDVVVSSPYCRTVDTALFAFNRVEVDENLRAMFLANKTDTELLRNHLSKLLSTNPKANYNNVLVGHTANLREATNVWPKPEGVIHIFKPTSQGYQHIGRIQPSKWDTLLK